jgi:D-alanyl-D-alanine carboxypeptidase
MKKFVLMTVLTSTLLTACGSNAEPTTSATTSNDLTAFSEGLSSVNDYYTAPSDLSSFINNTEDLSYIIDKQAESMKEYMAENNNVNEDGFILVNTPASITALVNKVYFLPDDYIPDDLVIPEVRFSFDGFDEKMQLRQEAAHALEKLFEAADEENIYLFAVSGYRSFQRQKTIYENNLRTKGEEYTNKYSARPGHSEHQTGLAMDVSAQSIGFGLKEAFDETPEGQWLKLNATRFGFIIRYPKDKTHITGYAFEPWHIRYVGEELAQYLEDNNLTLDEYYSQYDLIP